MSARLWSWFVRVLWMASLVASVQRRKKRTVLKLLWLLLILNKTADKFWLEQLLYLMSVWTCD